MTSIFRPVVIGDASRELAPDVPLLPEQTTAADAPDARRDVLWSLASPMMLLVLAHIPAGLVMNRFSLLTFVHAAVTFLLGVRVAMRRDDPARIACAAAYITGAEVLWRMTTDRLPWELGKYAVIAVCGTAILKRDGAKGLVAPLLFFSLLLPSAVLTLADFPLEEARQQISFNLSGPFALAICAGFFYRTTLTFDELQRAFLWFLAPVAGIAAIVLFGILTNPDITFNTESNTATSGGFGPNQVSAILGLGALLAFLSQFAARASWQFRLAAFGLLVWLGTHSALTFSRGGLFAAGGGAVVAALYYAVRYPGARLRLALVAGLVFCTGKYVIWPALDEFTDGTITARFTESDLSRRDEIGVADLIIWEEHPILGVGPGRSSLEHRESVIAHTEFTRVLAEHGVFGAAAIVLMLYLAYRNVRRAEWDKSRGFVLAMITWACLFMLNSAMRLAAPSFLIGLASAAFVPAGFERVAATMRRAPRRAPVAPRQRIFVRP